MKKHVVKFRVRGIVIIFFCYLCRVDIDNSKSSGAPKLKDDEILRPFMEYLEPACINIRPGESLIVYRTQDLVPVDEYGQSPRPRRKFGEEALKQKLTDEEVRALTPKKREKIMGDWGLSCNDSEESARKSFLYTYQKHESKGASKEDLEAFVHERGIHICRYSITVDTGIITPFDEHGHANLYLYEGVNIESCRDKEYNYTTIDYQSDED